MKTAAVNQAEEFLAQKRLAVVGVSRGQKEFSRKLFRELTSLGYDTVPVNPHTEELDERPCFASVSQISPPVDGVLVLSAPKTVNDVVTECLLAGVPRVWVNLGSGTKSLSPDLARRCHDSGVSLIQGFCPYMFLGGSGWFHRFHGWIAKRTHKNAA